MYYLKFMKWFWNEHLDQTSDKVGFCLIVWVAGIVISGLLGMAFKAVIFFAAYLMFSIACIILFAAGAGIHYMYQRYNEWQMQVIHKLKGQ